MSSVTNELESVWVSKWVLGIDSRLLVTESRRVVVALCDITIAVTCLLNQVRRITCAHNSFSLFCSGGKVIKKKEF